MNKTTPFPGSARPHELIGRLDDLKKLRQAITRSGKECRIVLIEGEGGVGKSRLVNTMLQYVGVPVEIDDQTPIPESEIWTEVLDKTVVTGLLDLAETKLQTQGFFLSKLADSATWTAPSQNTETERLSFNEFADAGQEWQRLSDLGIAFTAVREAAQKAEDAFWQDYRRITKEKRAVIVLDTAEQLIISSQWMIDAGLLQPDDVMFHVQRWLLTQIRAGHFANTTLCIVSRTKAGQAFIQRLQKAATETAACEWIPIPLKPFTQSEVRQYLEALKNDVQKETAETWLDEDLQEILKDDERLKVLWLYTGGQPIRLALYADILLTGADLPEPLQHSFTEAVERTKWVEGETETPELLEARQEIEATFSKALFQPPEADLSVQILQLLVRCPRGLTAEQIHFALDSAPKTKALAWQPDPIRLQEIRATMDQLRKQILVKSRDGGRLLYLQDEMYRIYDECMGRDPVDRQTETEARTWLYAKLRDWTEHQLQQFQAEKTTWVRRMLKEIRMERPSRISAVRFPMPTGAEAKYLGQLENSLFDAELEYLHYELLLDPQENFNDTYYNLVNRRETSYREDQINVLQAEVDRLIRTEHLMRLRPWESRESVRKRGEKPYDVLKRTVRTDEAIKWIIRFFLRKEYSRAIALAEALEEYIPTIEYAPEKTAWLHTLNRTERACYYHFARIYSGQNKLEAIESLKQLVAADAPLVKLSQMSEDQILAETNEPGFKGHPAHTRLLFVIAISWNVVGYGYATLGQYRDAVSAYTTSLLYTRLVQPPFMVASQATTLNNLARALSEIGRWHAVRLCQDGLQRRIELAEWLPIAFSYNTLGLIYNDFKEPQEALDYSALALAIARYVQDDRAVSLSMLQVGEALRSLVTLDELSQEDTAEEIFREAGNVLTQAYNISKKLEEPLRLAEAALELGSLHRDHTEYAIKAGTGDSKRWADNAEHYLLEAAKVAEAHGWPHLALDAWVGLAAVYFYAQQPSLIRTKVMPQIEVLVPLDSTARLKINQMPPRPMEHPAYLFKQLGKLHEILGRLDFTEFTEKMVGLRQEILDWEKRQTSFETNEALQTLLRQATEHYVLAVNYGQLYSPGSATLTHVYDQLFAFLKKFNYRELSKFYTYKAEIETAYRLREIEFEQPGNLDDFLWGSFGEYPGEYSTVMSQARSWQDS